jgi:hypothetical protein
MIADEFASERSERVGEPAHLVALRAAFPGVWVRSDGAFRHDETGIHWEPGDVERADPDLGATLKSYGRGLVRFGVNEAQNRCAALRLSQLRALTDYIAAESAI